jgi:hypothetical protein
MWREATLKIQHVKTNLMKNMTRKTRMKKTMAVHRGHILEGNGSLET